MNEDTNATRPSRLSIVVMMIRGALFLACALGAAFSIRLLTSNASSPSRPTGAAATTNKSSPRRWRSGGPATAPVA